MTKTKKQIADELRKVLIEEGPMKFTELKDKVDCNDNNMLYAIIYDDRFVMDDSWRFHLTNES